MRIFLLFLIISFTRIAGYAQITNGNPPVSPQAPEPYSFTKYGDLPIGLLTGTFQHSVPVYTITSGKLTHDISLSYSTNGVKVDEISSREGMGWTLNAGGTITRTVLDKRDENATRALWPTPNANPCDTCWDFWSYVKDHDFATQYDSQPDEFFYKVGGMSGKFYNTRNNGFKLLKPNGVTIAGTPMGDFTITGTDGTRYRFTQGEASRQYNLYGETLPELVSNTLYLTAIVSPGGDSIQFHYESISSVNYLTGITQTVPFTLQYPGGGSYYSYQGIGGSNMTGDACNSFGSATTSYNVNEVSDVKYLSYITFKNGRVNFKYSGRSDQPAEIKLDSVLVTRSLDGQVVKRLALHHSYAQFSGSDPNDNLYSSYPELKKRLLLDSVSDISKDGVTKLTQGFMYDSANYLPPRLSFSQDRYGYPNGKYNATYFFPNDTWVDVLLGSTHFGADRSFDLRSVKKGLLKKITYPTGGYSLIDYEANKMNNKGHYALMRDSLHAEMNPATYANQTVETDTFHLDNRSTVLRASCDWVTGPPEFFPDSYLFGISIINVATNECQFICDQSLVPGARINVAELTSKLGGTGGVFKVRLKAYNSGIIGKVTIERSWLAWDTVNTNLNGIAGVRVKSIESFTAPGNPASRKEYAYRSWEDASGKSGIGFNDYKDSWVGVVRTLGSVQGMSQEGGAFAYCGYNVFNSSSSLDLYRTDQSAVVYPSVIELNEANGKNNGGVEYKYYVDEYNGNQPARPLSYVGPAYVWDPSPIYIAGAPQSNYDFNTGDLISSKAFSYTTKFGTRKVLSETRNYYSLDTFSASRDSFYVINRAMPNPEVVNPAWKLLAYFDINKYFRNIAWSHLDSTVTTEFVATTNDSLSTTTKFQYSPLNFRVNNQQSTNSKGEVNRMQTRYGKDIGLTAANIELPVSMSTTRNGGVLTRDSISYLQWNGDHLPLATYKDIRNTGLQKRNQFQEYDPYGNIAQFTGDDGVINSFRFDYDHQYMTMKLSGGAVSASAYTSFEAESKGGWSYTGSVTLDATSPTGRNCYLLSGGNITRSGLVSGAYTIAYWSKTGSISVNGTAPTRTGRSVGNWRYYEHDVTGTSITIAGSYYIDELRCYPKGAQMTTYTYEPLIGITSQADPAGKITRFEYDGFNRLRIVRDQDGFILKRICYNYSGQPENCN